MEKIKICPVSTFTKMLGGKWKLIIINTIHKNNKLCLGKLNVLIPTISRKVLSDQLERVGKR